MEKEKLILTNKEWDLLIKKLNSIKSLSSIINKVSKMEASNKHPAVYIKQSEQIKIKTLECLDILNQN